MGFACLKLRFCVARETHFFLKKMIGKGRSERETDRQTEKEKGTYPRGFLAQRRQISSLPVLSLLGQRLLAQQLTNQISFLQHSRTSQKPCRRSSHESPKTTYAKENRCTSRRRNSTFSLNIFLIYPSTFPKGPFPFLSLPLGFKHQQSCLNKKLFAFQAWPVWPIHFPKVNR